MNYLLVGITVLLIAKSVWDEREHRRERAQTAAAHRSQTSELLTRLSHPELVVVPEDQPTKVLAPDEDPEPDEFAMVGQVIPGLDNDG